MAGLRSFRVLKLCMFGSPWSIFRRHLSCSGTHSTDAHQVVGQPGQAHQLLVSPNAAQTGLAQSADCLAPTKELLDAFAHDLTRPITGRFQRAFTDTCGVVSGVQGDMRSDALSEERFDEALRVITLVATDALGT